MYGLASRLGENIPGWRGKAGGGGVALVKKNRVRNRKELPVDTIGEQNNKALSRQSSAATRA